MNGSNSSEQFANIIRGVLGQSVSDDEILNRISQNLELLREVKEILHKTNPNVLLSPKKNDSNKCSFSEEKETLLSTLNDSIQNSNFFIQIKQQYPNSNELNSSQITNFVLADIEFARKVRNLKCLEIDHNAEQSNELDDKIINQIQINAEEIRNNQQKFDSLEEEKSKLEQIICDLRTELSSPHQNSSNESDLDSKIRAIHHDLKIHNRSLSQLVKRMQEQIKQLQQQIEKEQSKNFVGKEELSILQDQYNILKEENDNLKEQLTAVSKEKESEAIERLLNQLNLLSQEVAELREKLIKSKDTLFANRIRMNFKEIEDDEIVDMIGADGSLINALMRLLEPNASTSSIKEWRQKLITSIQGLEQNKELMHEIRKMFTVASKENLPIAARRMKDDDDALTKRTGELLEQVLNKISDKPEIDGLIVVTFILFTTFLLKPDELSMNDYFEIEEEEEDI